MCNNLIGSVTFKPSDDLYYYPRLPTSISNDYPTETAVGVPTRKPRLYAALGAARSGKTTEGRKWLHRLPNTIEDSWDGYPRYMWDTDKLRLEMHAGRYRHATEPMIFAIKNYAIRTALASGHDCYVAGTHTTKASIRRLLEIDRECKFVLFDTPEQICIDRARETNQEDLVPLISKLSTRVALIKDIGLDKYIKMVLDDMENEVKY